MRNKECHGDGEFFQKVYGAYREFTETNRGGDEVEGNRRRVLKRRKALEATLCG